MVYKLILRESLSSILVHSVIVSVQVDQRHWSPSVVTSSSQDAPGQGVVASDTNHLLGGVPELLGVQVALVHGHHDVEGVGNSITFKSFLQLYSKIFD